MHTQKLNKCDNAFLFFIVISIKFCDFLNQFESFSVYLLLLRIQNLFFLSLVILLILKHFFFLVKFMQIFKLMHPSKVI
jgi:hypothetical protein